MGTPEGHAAWVAEQCRRFERPLCRYAHSILGDAERARDVVQDVFAGLCGQDAARLDGYLAAWLFRVCRNRALDVRAKETRMATIAAATLERPDPGVQPAARLELADEASRMVAALDELPEPQREVLRLRFQGGLRYREIAEVTGRTVGHVGFLIHTAIRTLRERLGATPAGACGEESLR